MPISISAKKSLRKSIKNKKVNVSYKNKIKAVIKKFLVKPTQKGLEEVQSVLDKAKKDNIFHINKVSRLKSRLSKKVASVEVKKIAKKTVKKVKK